MPINWTLPIIGPQTVTMQIFIGIMTCGRNVDSLVQHLKNQNSIHNSEQACLLELNYFPQGL